MEWIVPIPRRNTLIQIKKKEKRKRKKSKIKSEMLEVKSENFIVVKKKFALNIILQY